MALRSAVRVQGFLRRLREESGQAAVEYGGILAVIALIFVALFALNLDTTISNAVKDAVNSILGNGGGGGGGAGGGGGGGGGGSN
jgi:Flp pilus assembly pilin Flp